MIDAYRIKKTNAGITEIKNVVDEWEIDFKDYPINLKIKVFKIFDLVNDRFIASSNYSIKKSKKDSDYIIISNHHTIQGAFENSFYEFLFYYNKKEIDHTDFVLDKNW